MSSSSRSEAADLALADDPVAATVLPWMTACAAGCLLFLGSLAAVAWQVHLSIEDGFGRWAAEPTWLQLPDVFEALEQFGGRAVVLPAALIMPLFLPIRRLRHWWLPVAVLLGSWTLASLAATAFGYLGLARDGLAFPDMDAVTVVAFLVIAAHLVECSLTRRSIKVTLWSCGVLVVAFASLDPLLFDPAHSLPLGGVAGAGLGLACAAAAAWWDEATPGLASAGVAPAAAAPARINDDRPTGAAAGAWRRR